MQSRTPRFPHLNAQSIPGESPHTRFACHLNLAVKTAETHRSNIMRKLGLHSISELVLYAVRNNIIQVTTDLPTVPAEKSADALPYLDADIVAAPQQVSL